MNKFEIFKKFLGKFKGNTNLMESIQSGYNAIFEGIQAYHGSGNDFTQFLNDKANSGQGLQKFGYGTYFTGSKQVAQYYAKDTTEK